MKIFQVSRQDERLILHRNSGPLFFEAIVMGGVCTVLSSAVWRAAADGFESVPWVPGAFALITGVAAIKRRRRAERAYLGGGHWVFNRADNSVSRGGQVLCALSDLRQVQLSGDRVHQTRSLLLKAEPSGLFIVEQDSVAGDEPEHVARLIGDWARVQVVDSRERG